MVTPNYLKIHLTEVNALTLFNVCFCTFLLLMPNCISLTGIVSLSLLSSIFSNNFIPCSGTFMLLKCPHSSGSPFCLNMGIISLLSHLSGICFSSQTVFSISSTMSTPLSPMYFMRCTERPEHPEIFSLFIFFIAFSTCLFEISWIDPCTTGVSLSCYLTFSTLSRLLKYYLHLADFLLHRLHLALWSRSLRQCLFLILPFSLLPFQDLLALFVPLAIAFSFVHSLKASWFSSHMSI